MNPRNGTRRRGPLVAALAVGVVAWAGCAKPPVAELYPQVEEYDGREIQELEFVDTDPFGADSLDALTETEETHCSLLGILPFCFPGTDWGLKVERLDMRTVGADLSRLAALYRKTGYFGTRVVPEIDEVGEDGGAIRVRFLVRRGDGVVLDSVVVEGTEGILDPDSLAASLPLQAGDLLDLGALVASADTVTEALRRRGHAYAEVLRNYGVDTIQDRAAVQLLAVPGPRVVVDTVLVAGIEELDRQEILRQLTFRAGDLLRLSDLRVSQRNLYDVEMIRFASVAVAPDTLQRTPRDSTTATVRVAIGEAPEHLVETRVGVGTVECVELGARWTDRSVLGGGRQVTVTGSVERIGCGRGDEEIGTSLDYRLAADFVQPYLLGPGNELAATAYTEQQSEPGLFQRTATGTQLTLSRRLRPRELITGGVAVEYRQTRATPELYCFEFRACAEEDIEQFLDRRWQNGLTANWIRDRGNSAVNPTSGYVLRSSLAWSTPLLFSDYEFLRANVEGSFYQSLGQGWVLAVLGRAGSFLGRASLGVKGFIPPEERFFAGGASSVRGYDRFGLGPGLYLVETERDPSRVVPSDSLDVEFFPTGGTSLGVFSVEARFPSPVLRDLLRLAVFVDGGSVGLDPFWQLESQWAVTPGLGLRIQTPVGPARVDVAYNPYPPRRAPLFATGTELGDDLVRIADSYRPPAPGPWDLDRFRIHIAVGQAF